MCSALSKCYIYISGCDGLYIDTPTIPTASPAAEAGSNDYLPTFAPEESLQTSHFDAGVKGVCALSRSEGDLEWMMSMQG